jgi:hypothetical protein
VVLGASEEEELEEEESTVEEELEVEESTVEEELEEEESTVEEELEEEESAVEEELEEEDSAVEDSCGATKLPIQSGLTVQIISNKVVEVLDTCLKHSFLNSMNLSGCRRSTNRLNGSKI